MSDPIRVLIADDHTIVRSGLSLLLGSEEDISVVAEAKNGREAVALAKQTKPDVILMDIGMPQLNGFDATRSIKETDPSINILVLTMHRSDEYFFQMLEAGASGYILKGAETSELVRAVRTVSTGEVFLYPSMAQRLVQEYLRQTGSDPDSDNLLTPREREVLKLIADGYSSKEIAEQLVVSPSTIHTHRTNLMTKLDISSRHELVQYARRHGLIRNP